MGLNEWFLLNIFHVLGVSNADLSCDKPIRFLSNVFHKKVTCKNSREILLQSFQKVEFI